MSKQTSQFKTDDDFKAVRIQRLKEFKDGYEVIFKQVRCPACGTLLLLKRAIVSSWPYIHGDYELYCVDCDFTALFGIPEDPVVGMELIIWDDAPAHVLAVAQQEPAPICPFHLTPMEITKIWGNRVRSDDTMRIQWKCPEWFLTSHKTVPRASSTASATATTAVTAASSTSTDSTNDASGMT